MPDDSLSLKKTFNTTVDLYHKRRPTYPPELFKKLLTEVSLPQEAELLEIGPGTGQATKALAKMNYHITAVELGANLAVRLKEEMVSYPNVSVVTGAFEDVDLPNNHYDLIYSATAFHWIKPEVKFVKTHELLKLDGHLAIIHTEHISDAQGDAFFLAGQSIHQKYRDPNAPINKRGDFTLPKLADLTPPEHIDTRFFKLQSFSAFPVTIAYTSQEYVELMGTYSPQLAMPKAKREAFMKEIKELIDQEFEGHLSKPYGMTLTIARRVA